ncbi:SAM-dependent methyltransferase [Marinomonas algarum]|uniref:Tetrapyrrole methylase domain-containing protein n=1 Tax=Marinomonas algarum TaxID=2883105 RepID=A0A9X1RW62_9GAMM|nr:SAM-dependent methyltransferase [Marinomonas algarum]MCB5163177.1 hypothetical protein [Marinomonas algarum]
MNSNSTHQMGRLHLVSAGIGDSDNLTLKAVHVIQEADVVIAMQFVQRQTESYYKECVQVFDAGHGLFTELSRRGNADVAKIEAQENKIRDVIHQSVQCGLNVAVIEFGDPTLYGPQVGYLKEFSELKPIIVPGISSFNAANAMLRQSLLNSQSQTLMLSSVSAIQQYKVNPPSVLVLFTMKMEIEKMVEALLELYVPETQVALAFNAGFTTKQQTIYVKLRDLVEESNKIDIPWECLVYVGNIKEMSDDEGNTFTDTSTHQ